MNNYLGFNCIIKMNEELYFSSFRGNGLFRYDGKVVECVACFEEKGIKLFSGIELYCSKLYFTPFTASKIYIYDLNDRKINSISYEGQGFEDFAFSVLYGHYIYMFPSHYPGILKLSLDTLDMEKIDDWIGEDFKRYQLEQDVFFKGEYVQRDDAVYIPFYNACAVLEFNLNDNKSIIHGVGSQGYETIADDGKAFWMMSRKDRMIVCWNPCTDKITQYSKFPMSYNWGTFVGSLSRNGYVWIFPERANMVLKVETLSGEITEEKLFSKVCKHKWISYSLWGTAFIFVARNMEQVLLCSGKSSQVIVFYVDRNQLKCSRLNLPKEIPGQYHEETDIEYIQFRKKRYVERRRQEKFFFESEEYLLCEFIEDVEKNGTIGRRAGQKLRVGESIYENIALNYAE